MDTTYFINREQETEIGLLLFRAKEIRNNNSNRTNSTNHYQNILRIYITKSETVEDYIKGIRLIKQSGYKIKSFTVDNKSGLIKRLITLYPTIPVQLCLFHFVKAVNKYLTRNPKNNCDKELKLLLLKLKSDISEFIFKPLLADWIKQNLDYINARNHKGGYLHIETVSTLKSINQNLNYIFRKQRYPYLSIPNTNNSMEGGFGHLKPKVILHRGLSEKRKKQMIDCLLMHQNGLN
jgi:Transposase, Mutator family